MVYIDPDNAEQLADLLIDISMNGWAYGYSNLDYEKKQNEFAKSVAQLFLQ